MAKKKKVEKRIVYVLIMLIILTFSIVGVTFFGEQKKVSDKNNCFLSGGEWIEFRDTCANTCNYERGSDQYCAQALTLSCQCEEGKCWDGESCIPI